MAFGDVARILGECPQLGCCYGITLSSTDTVGVDCRLLLDCFQNVASHIRVLLRSGRGKKKKTASGKRRLVLKVVGVDIRNAS